jgi:drug/metabolite transporter superfamily protein YnfA
LLVEQIQASPKEFRPALGRLVPTAILILLCLPSLLFVWHNRDVPHFGILQDDGIYLIDAKALAQGDGYRILSLAARPFDTRYPPLYPFYLSLAWRSIPAFPANLTLAIMLSWLCLPVVLGFVFLWCRRHAFPLPITWLAVGLFALNPYVLFFASNLGSEMLFMVFLLGAILVAERQGGVSLGGWCGPLLAGAIAGAGYLTRTSGIALLPAAIAYYMWKKQPRGALWFTLGMLPAIAGWMLWSRMHAAPGHDVVTLCYTNYLGYYFMNVGRDNILQILWRNGDALLEAMGSLVFPQAMEQGLLARLILWPIAVAMILGCIRMVQQGFGRLYAFFGGVSLAMLLVWHYQPNQRFVLPLAPLLLAGFCFEAANIAEWFRKAIAHHSYTRRLVAFGIGGSLVTVLTGGLVLQLSMDFSVVPNLFRSDRSNTQAYRSMYGWIASHLPADVNILWQDDTALYLATGRHAVSFVVPPREFAATGGDAGEVARYRRIAEYAHEQHLDYVLLAKFGLRHNDEVLREAAANPKLEPVHEEEGGILYRVR